MSKRLTVNISIIFILTAILMVPSLVLQISFAQTDADLENTVIEIHNRERAEVGVPDITWSSDLAADAQKYADYLTTLGLTLEDKAPHAPFNPDNPQGENLWMGTAGLDSNVERVEWFANEKSDYNGELIKDSSEVGPNDPVTGHYTQMVWRETTQVGCANSSDGNLDFMVCRYSPPGNYVGEKPY